MPLTARQFRAYPDRPWGIDVWSRLSPSTGGRWESAASRRGSDCSTRPASCSRRMASVTCAWSTSPAPSVRRPRPSTSTSEMSRRPCSRSPRRPVTRSGRSPACVDEPWAAPGGLERARALVDGFVSYWDRHRAVLRTRNLAAQEGDVRFREVRNATLADFIVGFRAQIERGRSRGRDCGIDVVRGRGRGARRAHRTHGRVPP